MDINDLIPISEYAAQHGKNAANIRQKCLRGTMPGAMKVGRDWFVPKDTDYTDKRVKTGKYRDWRKPKPDQ